jgi:hypothetical protein
MFIKLEIAIIYTNNQSFIHERKSNNQAFSVVSRILCKLSEPNM